MEVGVRVEAGPPVAAARAHAASAYLTFVAVGDDRKPVQVRPLVLETAEEQLRAQEAAARREQRLQLAAARKVLRAAHDRGRG